jgi:protein-disulfide isomerase
MPPTLTRLLALLVALVACAASQPQPTTPARLPQVDSPRLPVGRSPARGRPDALVTVVEFGDLTATASARVEAALARLRLEFGDELRVVWKHRPAGGRRACPARAAEVAQEVLAQQGADAFWRYHDAALDGAGECDEDAVVELAGRFGANVERVRAAVDEHVHEAAVADDLDLAARLDVDDAPALYVNGARLAGDVTTERLRAAVERARAEARAVTPQHEAYARMVAAAGERAATAERRGYRCREGGDGEERRAQADADRIPVRRSPAMGCPDALVTVVVFSDFQCPFCRRVTATLAALRERYGADLRVVWKNNPLAFHERARPAAEAAMEAYAQRGDAGFWRFHDALFDDQESIERSDLEAVAERQGLDMERFNRALDEHTHAEAIDRDQELAERLHADGTPNFFINGTQFVGAQPQERFEEVIDRVLARARDVEPRHRAYAEMVSDPVEPPADPANNPPPPPPQRTEDPAAVYDVPIGLSPTQGPDTALVTVVTFSDFQCPFCSRVAPTLRSLRRRYGNELRLVWRDAPLPFHDRARPAAEAAREAFAQQGSQGFWRFHDALFEHQQSLGDADLERYAQAQGLDMARFRRAMADHTHAAAVDANLAAAQRVEANGTPHFFINGRRLVGAQPEEAFVQRIDEAMARARALLATPGTTRQNLYARTIANGATGTVYLPGGAAPAAGAAPADDEDRVYTLRRNPRAPSRGPANAPVVIEYFSDFQCPFCGRVRPTLDAVLQRNAGRVRLVWRDYPLPFHDHAMLAAEAAREALAQRGAAGFWRFYDALFENQQHIERADLERYAQAQGLDMPRFRRALDGHTHQAAIRDDMAAADATGAQIGTPAFFVNGRFFAGALPEEEFQRRIDRAAAAAPARPAGRRGR